MNAKWLGLLLLLALGASCATTYQARHAKPSGFLGDYSQLREGEGQEPLLVYFNPAADVRAYDRILIDPVAGYVGEGSRLDRLSVRDRQALLDYFHAALRERLGQDYELVDQPGPRTLRLRVAVTDARRTKPVADTLSTVVPVGLAISALQRVALGKTLATGSVRVEAEALDAQTGERLAAMVDERVGAKVTGRFDKWSKWQDARDAFDYWSARMRGTLRDFREGAGEDPRRAPKK